MDRSRHEPEFDEFEKLLGEIPKVTSGTDYNHFPICLSSSRSSQSIKKLDQFEEQYVPQDTTSFAESNLNFGFPNQTPESPHPMFMNPSYHSPSSSPCVYDKFDSRKLDPLRFRKLQQLGYFPNFSSGISPAQPQHYLPPSQPLSHYPSFDQSHMNWRNMEEENLQRLKLQEEQYLSMNHHFHHLYSNSQSMHTSPRQEHFDYRRAEQSNRNLFWDGEDGHERVRSMDGVRKMYYPEKILMKSQHGLNTAKVIKYGAGDDSQDERLWLQNQLNEDLTLSLNNLTLQPQKYNSLAEARGRIYYLAKDQLGCRFLQKIFAEKDGNDIEIIFNEIIDYISELMIDPFGNYLVQKLLEVCNEDQRMQIIHAITRKPGLLIRISCDMHG